MAVGGVLRVGGATIDLDHNEKEMESLMGGDGWSLEGWAWE